MSEIGLEMIESLQKTETMNVSASSGPKDQCFSSLQMTIYYNMRPILSPSEHVGALIISVI